MIVPIINEQEREKAVAKIARARDVATRVQIDIEDGMFVDRFTIFPSDLVDVEWGGLSPEYHLMVDDPTEWIEECVSSKAVKIIGQVERMGNQELFVSDVSTHGVMAGLGLELLTPLSALSKKVLDKVDTILLLSIPTGPSGSEIDERIYAKIRELRNIYAGTIFVDGGVNPETYRRVREAGADEAGSSSYLWQGELAEKLLEFEEKL